MRPFTHLHVHTEYSLLDGSAKIRNLIARTKELGMDSLAITDHGVMYGVVDFYKAAKAAGINPVIGCEMYVAPTSRFEKVKTDQGNYMHLVLLAENQTGYQNLIKLVSLGFTEGFYYRPRVDFELLKKYSEGLIALSACLSGVIPRVLLTEGYDRACQIARDYNEVFGQDNFFLELGSYNAPEQQRANIDMKRMSRELGIPMVATNDVHYIHAEDAKAQEILLCIQTGKTILDEDRMQFNTDQFYLKSPDEMYELFDDVPEALENTQKIADRCHVEFEFNNYKLPKFILPEAFAAEGRGKDKTSGTLPRTPQGGQALRAPGASAPVLNAPSEQHLLDHPCGDTDDDKIETENTTEAEKAAAFAYLTQLCEDGLVERYGDAAPLNHDRLAYELSVIGGMGFVDYFLIVWDFIRYARENGIMVGPGRGSGAGSIVAYVLRITDVDPIPYNLLFERFLNPERVSMPDFDIDFCYERRQEVIDYVVDKYGAENVSQIITFGTMAARAVTRDVGRALAMNYNDVDRIAKMIPMELGINLKKALEMSQELKQAYEEEEDTKTLMDMALKLEGLPRHAGTHPAGVVICNQPVSDYMPLNVNDGVVTTQFPMGTVEELGLLKMDFLGLRTLTVIRRAAEEVARSKDIKVDVINWTYDDPNVYALISRAHTDGVFQLESSGMKSFMKDLQPKDLEDVIAGISLYRPGPMDSIPKFLKGKKNPKRISYLHPALEPILNTTYGCIVYQEQVMQIVRDLAGFSMGRSDLMRRAMSKKVASVMEGERHVFVHGSPEAGVPGCVANGIPEAAANQIFDDMADFAAYAFNKPHAAGYALLSYQTAWLKHYHPVEFMAATMTSIMDNTVKVAAYIHECKKMGITLLPPDINEGYSAFSVSGNSIRFGLAAIRNVGRGAVEAIVKEREIGGPYRGITDFINRLQTAADALNKRCLESLIKSGAFDSLGGKRVQYMAVFPGIVSGIAHAKKSTIEGQLSLFDLMDDPSETTSKAGPTYHKDELPYLNDVPKRQMLADEKEMLGIYVSGHPLSDYENVLRRYTKNNSLAFAADNDGADAIKDGADVKYGGLITAKSVKYTKRDNKPMAFLTVEDMYGAVEVIVFAQLYEKQGYRVQTDQVIIVAGRASVREEEAAKIVANELLLYDDIPQNAYDESPTDHHTPTTTRQSPGNVATSAAPAQSPRTLWLKLPADRDIPLRDVTDILSAYPGNTPVMIYNEKSGQKFAANRSFHIRPDPQLAQRLKDLLGEAAVKIVG